MADEQTGDWTQILRSLACFEELEEQEIDILTELPADLELKAREMGGLRLLASLEDTLSGFFRINDRKTVGYADAEAAAGRLFDEHVDSTPQDFITHLPLYGLRAAATKFGEGMEVKEDRWVRVPGRLKLSTGMFVGTVVGRSMEPLIYDGELCIFRAGVGGSRYGRYLLIEKFDETDFAARYTVKRYARTGRLDESAEREQEIPLEPLNPDFEGFSLTSDKFRVIAEFVEVLRL